MSAEIVITRDTDLAELFPAENNDWWIEWVSMNLMNISDEMWPFIEHYTELVVGQRKRFTRAVIKEGVENWVEKA